MHLRSQPSVLPFYAPIKPQLVELYLLKTHQSGCKLKKIDVNSFHLGCLPNICYRRWRWCCWNQPHCSLDGATGIGSGCQLHLCPFTSLEIRSYVKMTGGTNSRISKIWVSCGSWLVPLGIFMIQNRCNQVAQVADWTRMFCFMFCFLDTWITMVIVSSVICGPGLFESGQSDSSSTDLRRVSKQFSFW